MVKGRLHTYSQNSKSSLWMFGISTNCWVTDLFIIRMDYNELLVPRINQNYLMHTGFHCSDCLNHTSVTPMIVWRELLRLSSALLNQSDHTAINAIYFDRRETSNHYLKRYDQDIRTVQAMLLVDTAQSAVSNIHCSAK